MTYKADYKKIRQSASKLYQECQGVMLMFLLIFYVLKQVVLFPLGNRLWRFALTALPSQYVTERNFWVSLRYPHVWGIAFLLIVGFCLQMVWELSGIILCFAYNEQKKPIHIFKLFYYSLVNIRPLLSPKNWIFFVYLLLILPLVNPYSALGMASSISIPEYIMDFILASPLLLFPFLLLSLFFAYLTFRWFYVIEGILIGQKDFSVACKESTQLTKGRKLRQIFDLGYYEVVQSIKIGGIPLVLSILLFFATRYLFASYAGEAVAAKIAYVSVFFDMFKAFFRILMEMATMSYLITNYKALAEQAGFYQPPQFPDTIVKTGRIWKFRALKPLIYLSCVLISQFLFGFLLLLFENNPQYIEMFGCHTQIAAHKGYSSAAPENTLPAFEMAATCGTADMIELDIRESKDGIPVIIHNASLKTATGVKKSVYELEYADIRELPAYYGYSQEAFGEVYIPTLEEVLVQYGNRIPLILEIKMDDSTPDLPRKIVQLLEQYDCKQNCVIHSGSYEALEMVKELDSTIPCGYIIAMGVGAYYDLPSADFFSVEHSFVNGAVVERIHDLDKKIYVWTVNETSSIEQIKNLGVDVVITDYPDVVHQELHDFDTVVEEFKQKMTLYSPERWDDIFSSTNSDDY